MLEILIATSNNDKLIEIKKILQEYKVKFISLKDWCSKNGIKIPEIVEDGKTFKENSFIKAKKVFALSGIPTLADDTGLEVISLKGKPGIFSARFSEPFPKNASKEEIYKLNREKLLKEMHAKKDRKARFLCHVTLILNENTSFDYEGVLEGSIGKEPRGSFGFGYDPIFIISDKNKTFSELTMGEKNKISHRALALRGLFENLKHKGFL